MAQQSKDEIPPDDEQKTPDHEQFFKSPREFFNQLFDLREGLDTKQTIEFIRNNDEMVHANSWLLMSSIFICSVGLDLGSPAIIIGGMLITPLMAPILGIGLAIGINDRNTLFITIRHFIAAAILAIIASSLYFWLNPLGAQVPTEQITSRTEPTVLDGLVAIFGGIAGIISISHPEKSNAIPGVAIAIALMPPLCVVGYGLANGAWNIFGGAFYLFFINSFFVAFSSFALVRYMRFPFKEYVNRRERRKTLRIVLLISLLILLPSSYILFTIYQTNVQKTDARAFVSTHFGAGNNPRAIDWEYVRSDSSNQLIIELLGNPVSPAERDSFQKELGNYNLEKTKLDIIQGSSIELTKLETNLEDIVALIDRMNRRQDRRNIRDEIDQIKNQLRMQSSADTTQMERELIYLFPGLKDIHFQLDTTDNPFRHRFEWDEKVPPDEQEELSDRIRRFIKLRENQH